AEQGLSVLVIGCDQKHDCTRNLRGEVEIPTILDLSREKGIERLGLEGLVGEARGAGGAGGAGRAGGAEGGSRVRLDEVVYKGYRGVFCAECGGPRPGIGCAGRGVIVAIELLKRLNAFEELEPKPEVVIYDVPGDVVCGGFAMPLRGSLADEVFVVTSADYLALYAANNICRGIKEFAAKGGTPLGGFVYNVRGVLDDEAVVRGFAERVGSQVLGCIPNAHQIAEAEIEGRTVIEHAPESEVADLFRELALRLYNSREVSVPEPLPADEMVRVGQEIRKRARERTRERTSERARERTSERSSGKWQDEKSGKKSKII
ncbi:MAG TPA: hypothetical protein ENG23_02765, partial [Methanomicrobia archaeon]|nr:hypothetical protein [Methanomicrobia archaeon]